MKDLVTKAVKDKTFKLLEKAKKKTKRVIAESDLADVFGIDMEDLVISIKKSTKVTIKSMNKKNPLSPAPEKTKAKSKIGKSGEKSTAKQDAPRKKVESPFDIVVGIIMTSKKDITVALIKESGYALYSTDHMV